MKFLIQKIDKRVRHDFSFVLLEAIEFRNWFNAIKTPKIKVKYFNPTSEQKEFIFEEIHRGYTPVGSVEFVCAFLQQFYGLTPTPLNVPKELFHYTHTLREIFNGTEKDIVNLTGKWFVKSNDKIKGFSGIITFNGTSQIPEPIQIPIGNYQFSKYIDIRSEWRAFVYEGKLVGLQNYSGEFTQFPSVYEIREMIKAYKSAPIAYTLDVGISGLATVIIEVHDFFSCGLYGFANLAIYPQMLHKWFYNYTHNK
jgi:hypothetical protein